VCCSRSAPAIGSATSPCSTTLPPPRSAHETLLINGVLSIVIGVAAALLSIKPYAMADEWLVMVNQNKGIAEQALRAGSELGQADPRREEEMQKALRYARIATFNQELRNEELVTAVVYSVVSAFAVLTGAILLAVRHRRRTKPAIPMPGATPADV